mmetsp:Transcript_20731/g.69535  ORF Transcript_20731/g.69535 Transcript_20731/m.69535 type:complete len:204 (-) Transcript_20731:645-1256(-)
MSGSAEIISTRHASRGRSPSPSAASGCPPGARESRVICPSHCSDMGSHTRRPRALLRALSPSQYRLPDARNQRPRAESTARSFPPQSTRTSLDGVWPTAMRLALRLASTARTSAQSLWRPRYSTRLDTAGLPATKPGSADSEPCARRPAFRSPSTSRPRPRPRAAATVAGTPPWTNTVSATTAAIGRLSSQSPSGVPDATPSR